MLQGGTLGDAHCIYCRLYRIWELYGVEFEWTRTCSPWYTYFDKPIAEYFSRVPIVNFKGSRTDLTKMYKTMNGRRQIEKEYGYDLVCSTFGDIRRLFPRYDRINCFPKYDYEYMGNGTDPTVVIQVQGGKYKGTVWHDGQSSPHGDLRFFHPVFVKEMSEFLYADGFEVVLIGVEDKYTYRKEEYNFDNVINRIGKTTVDVALDYIASASCFIGFDGVFSFFAPSMRVPTIQFSHLETNKRMMFDAADNCGDGCEKWFGYTEIVRPVPTCRPLTIPMDQFKKLFNKVM